MTETGWTCPRCKRIYAPATPECRACNEAIEVVRKLGMWPDTPSSLRGNYEAQRIVDRPEDSKDAWDEA